MDNKEWFKRASEAIANNDLKEAKTLNTEIPFRFGVPPVSVANWNDLSWIKWLVLFCPIESEDKFVY
jgi:hypothetical protein